MIKIVVTKKHDLIKKITIEGHAKYDEKGKDIVCAGVSAIVFGTLNVIDQKINSKNYEIINDKKVEISCIIKDSNMQEILTSMIIQLETIKNSYPKYVKIIQEEENV